MPQPEMTSLAEITASLGLGSELAESDRGLLLTIKGMVENEIRRYCGHAVTQASTPFVHLLPDASLVGYADPLLAYEPTGSNRHIEAGHDQILQLPNPFVRTASLEVRIDVNAAGGQAVGAFGDETELALGIDYYLDADETGLSRSGRLIRISGHWPRRARSIRVSYFAGLTAAELDGEYSDIKLAVIDEVIQRFQMTKSRQGSVMGGVGTVRSESIGGEYQVTYDTTVQATDSLLPVTRDRLAPYVSVNP